MTDIIEPLRFSRLKLIGRSPAHYAAGTAVFDQTAVDRGSAVHAALLGGKRVISAPMVRRGKEWEAFKADNSDAIILTEAELYKASGMVRAVQANKEAMRVLDGVREKTLAWSIGGRPCVGTPDVYTDHLVTELKTTKCSEPRKFAWQARSLAYHAQVAWYRDGIMLGDNKRPADCYCVAVESAAPFPVTVFQFTPRMLEEGRKLYSAWLNQLKVCEDSDEWPGYTQGIVELDVADDEPELDWSDMEDAK